MSAATFIGHLGWTLVHFAWQGAVIGCAAAIALILMRNAKPEHRYTVACVALLLCLAWPAFDLAMRLTSAEVALTAPQQMTGLVPAPLAAGDEWRVYLQRNLGWIVGCWAACAAALAIRMALGLLWVRQAGRQRDGAPHWQAQLDRLARQFGITRAVRLRVVEHLPSPITAGWLRPVVLVPASLISGMPPQLLEALLAHELAHVKRFDYLVNLGQNVIETLLFYHPAVWWISNRIRVEREQIADDFAARQLGEPRRLALALSELERFQFSTHHLAQAANGGDLMSRIKRLVRPDTQALNWKAAIPVLGLVAASMAMFAHATPAAQGVGSTHTTAVAKFDSCAKPVYPRDALQKKQTGTVSLAFLVGADGKVKESKVSQSSGYPSLDEAAHVALTKCTFKPATQNGKAVQEWTAVQYVWALS
jgi:D-alanyl-D-alanine endopeptidase (penicillin-binding protein 7)